MSTTRSHRGATADMRSSINNQIQQWAARANWVDDEKAERIFWKMGQTTEDYINPNPETCGSYREEASRIYEKIKDEYGLRTVREARKEAREWENRAQKAAADKLREHFDAIDGEREAFTVLKQFREPTGHSVIGVKLLDEDLTVWEFREVRADGIWYDLRPDDDNAPVRRVPGDRERIQDWERVGHDMSLVEKYESELFERHS